MAEIISIIFFTIFLTLWSPLTGQGCGTYCVCSLERTECYFTRGVDGDCMGSIPLRETYVLSIHGPVCDEQRKKLKESIFDNTVKIFHNDACSGVLNCRYLSS